MTTERTRLKSTASGAVSLKMLAAHVGLSPAAVSLVLNGSPRAESIPRSTQERIIEGARELNYRPNFFARSLRKKRSFTIGILVPDAVQGHAAHIVPGIESQLLEAGFFYFLVSHHWRSELLERYPKLLMERSVEGLIAVNTKLHEELPLPVVTIAGHPEPNGVTNIVLDHQRAAELALGHLVDLGHRRVAFIKGQSCRADSANRWSSMRRAAKKLNVKIDPELCLQPRSATSGLEVGYPAVQELLSRRSEFTAILAFDDLSAIGAIRGLRDAGLRVPEDISVVGVDDIPFASFHNPSLTTVRQPLENMGKMAARALLAKINSDRHSPVRILMEPELVVRESTAPCKSAASRHTERRLRFAEFPQSIDHGDEEPRRKTG